MKYISGSHGHFNDDSALESYIDECENDDFIDLMDFIFRYYIGNKEI